MWFAANGLFSPSPASRHRPSALHPDGAWGRCPQTDRRLAVADSLGCAGRNVCVSDRECAETPRDVAAKMMTIASTSITVRDIDPAGKSWLEREARQVGVSVEEFMRRMIHEKREKAESRPRPSEAFARCSGSGTGLNSRPGRLTAIGRCRSPHRIDSDRPPCVANRHERRLRDDAAHAGTGHSSLPGLDRGRRPRALRH